MGDGYNFKQLREGILELSRAADWDVARKEWSLVNVYEADEPETCLCGHFPIVEICQISNRVTGHGTEVGNRCVRRFLGFRSDLIFAAIKRIRKDMSRSLNADAIAFFKERGALNEWEYGFLQDTKNKRSLSTRQMTVRRRINAKILSAINRRGFKGPT